MKNSILYIFIFLMILMAPGVFAQTASNTDFDPFPQMEQDMSNTDDQAAQPAQQQNDDWPPANSNMQANSEG